MEQFNSKLKRVLRKNFTGYFPKALPHGVTEFEHFCGYVFDTYGIPNLPSYREAVATMIMHLGPTVDTKAPHYFAKSIRKAMSNEVAYSYLQDRREEKKAEAAAKKVEAEQASV